jgi:choline-sulfatase
MSRSGVWFPPVSTPASTRRPNLLLLITDQQRTPMHWPSEHGWLEELMPNEAELRRTGVSFENACTATAMCSPSRASFLTGTYPSRHGVTLTLTNADLKPNPRFLPDVLREVAAIARGKAVPPARLARSFLAGALGLDASAGGEPELPAAQPTLGTRLRDAGYKVLYKGKWHLTAPLGGGHEWAQADAERLERDYGFGGWEIPDAGENTDPRRFGGGNAGDSGLGWDEDYTRQVERFLSSTPLPEPFCLIVSLVNPHDVLGYPHSYAAGGYSRGQFAHLRVPLPPTIDERLLDKPIVHSLMQLGQTSYVGALRTRSEQQDYVNFYAYLHRVVDEKVGRLLRALGDPADPRSLRSKTIVARISDHGEMGLSHGGLRQKMFNAYEETVRVPLVFSNPLLFPRAAVSEAPVSLVDLVPTLLDLAGAPATGTLDGASLSGVLAGAAADADAGALRGAGLDASGVTGASVTSVPRERALFTYDDHQAGTARRDAPGQPNRLRSVREDRWKYSVYLDPDGQAPPEYELYDLQADPNESHNLVERDTSRPRRRAAAAELGRLHEALIEECERTGTPVYALKR